MMSEARNCLFLREHPTIVEASYLFLAIVVSSVAMLFCLRTSSGIVRHWLRFSLGLGQSMWPSASACVPRHTLCVVTWLLFFLLCSNRTFCGCHYSWLFSSVLLQEVFECALVGLA